MIKAGNSSQLKYSIHLLESEQMDKEKILKERYTETVESIKPSNIIKETLGDLTSSSFLMEKALNIAMVLVGGYISKKIVVGKSNNKIRKLFGNIVQFEVSNLIAKHPEIIKAMGLFIFQSFIERNKKHVKIKKGTTFKDLETI